MNLIVLSSASILWGAMLWAGGLLAQRYGEADGAARQVIWRLAALLLIAPWIIAPVGILFGLKGPAPPPIVMSAEPVVLTAWSTSDASASVAPASAAQPLRPIPWETLIAAALIAGWIWRAIAAQLAKRALGRILLGATPAGEGLARKAVQRWKQRLRLGRAPELRVIDAGVSPFSFGARRPVIAVPRDLERRLDLEAIDFVVGHECLHIARGDGWLRPIERLVADLLWFNPFAWLIRRELDFARELACDEAVLAHVTAPRAYARTLRDVASLASGLSSEAPAAAMSLAGGGQAMVKRVKGALGYAKRRPAWSALIAASGLALLGAPVAIGQAVLAAPPPDIIAPPPPPAPPAAAKPAAPKVPAIAKRAPPAPPKPADPVFDSQDGLVRTSGAAHIISVTGGDGRSFQVELEPSAASGSQTSCHATISGLASVRVKAGDTLPGRGVVGEMGKGQARRISVRCWDDSEGQTLALAPIAPLAPVAAVAPIRPAAPPLAPLPPKPPIPVTYAPPAAPEAPAPPAPQAAPQPAPAPRPLPVPQVAPVPSVAPIPDPASIPRNPMPISWASQPVLEKGARITSPFGWRVDPLTSRAGAWHEGVDLAAPLGASIHTPAAGTVTFAGEKAGYASVVEIAYADGVRMRYAHLRDVAVRAGQSVKAGDVIGTVGTDDKSTGPHVHFEILEGGVTQDPELIAGLTLIAK